MQAIQLQEPRNFHYIDVVEPEELQPGEALVRVHRVGVCGTDVSGYLGKMPFFSYPRIPGHELGVEVLAVAEDVDNVAIGQPCSVEPYINNPQSFASQRGRTNCCNDLQVLGVHTDGGMRPRFVVPARKLHPSHGLEYEQLALVETLAIGCHAVARAAPRPQENCLVIGAGPIGLTVVEFLKLADARVIVLDLNEQRLEFVRNVMGVPDTVVGGDSDAVMQQLRDLTDGELPTVVVDATGAAASMSHCLNYAASTGRVIYVGITTDEVHFRHPLMHAKELTLLASRNALPEDFTNIIAHIEAGRINTDPWITHRVPFGAVVDQFESLTKPETGVIKAVIEMDDAN